MELERKTLQAWLAERHMTQQAVAIAAGMHVSSIGAIAAGRFNPRLRTKRAIADALGIRAEQIIWPAVTPPPSTRERYTGARRGPKPRKRATDALDAPPSKTLAPVA